MRSVRLKAPLLSLLSALSCEAFAPSECLQPRSTKSTALSVYGSQKSSSRTSLSPLPKGISPFEKSLSKNLNIQAEFRQRAKRAIDDAIANNVKLMEIEFPPVRGN